jgi:hypothetical protein
MKYLLPCACGRPITIDVSQAGQQVACDDCGQSQEVPTMRAIRALAPAKEENAVARQRERPDWSQLQGLLFGSGALVIFVSCCLAAYFGYLVSQIDTREPPHPTEQQVDASLKELPVDQAYDLYSEWKQSGLGSQRTPAYLLNRQTSRYFVRLTLISLAGATVGLGLVIGSLVARPARPRT